MNNKKLKITISGFVLTVIILSFSVSTFASDSTSIKIGCVIPAITGVNVLLVEEDMAIQRETEEAEIELIPPDSPSMFQKDEEITRLDNGKETRINVKTIYSR